jgi:hypothetical protein
MRACGPGASATLRDKMAVSGQTLTAVTAQLPWAAHTLYTGHPTCTIGRPGPAPRPHTDRSWPPRWPGGAGASFRPGLPGPLSPDSPVEDSRSEGNTDEFGVLAETSRPVLLFLALLLFPLPVNPGRGRRLRPRWLAGAPDPHSVRAPSRLVPALSSAAARDGVKPVAVLRLRSWFWPLNSRRCRWS